jgi:mRNA interferase HicA
MDSTRCESNRSVRQSEFRWVPERGSGSHGTLYLDDWFTVVKDLKKELGPGLLSDLLEQLGISKEDL